MGKCPKLKPKQIQELQEVINNSGSSGREVRRAQAILLVDHNTDTKAITALTKYSRRQVFDLRKNYLIQGITSIQDKKKGKPRAILTTKQRNEVLDILRTKTPRAYDYDWNWWTTGILADFIKRQYEVQYRSKTSLYIIFRKAKFTYHKPGRVYEKRNEQEVREWRKSAKDKVKQALQEQNTVVLVEDEMCLSTQTTVQKIWLPKGEYPKIEVSSKKEARSIYGFLNIKTGTEHAFKTTWQNMYVTREILGEVRKSYPHENILLIWDKAPWHKGSQVKEFIAEDRNIETVEFPRAAPEENPQEHVWKDGRSKVSHNRFLRNIDDATDAFVTYLNNTKFHYSFLGYSAGS